MPAIKSAPPLQYPPAASQAGDRWERPGRVAIDASFLDFPPSGIRTYVEQLARELAVASDDLSYSLIAPERRLDVDQVSPAALQRWAGLPRSRRQRFSWDIHGVSRAAHQVSADLLHIPHFSAPWRSSIPLVVTIHDLIPLLWPEYRRSPAMRANLQAATRLVRRATRVICPSQSAKRETEELLGIPPERIDVIPMAASGQFQPRAPDRPMAETLRRFGIDGPFLFNVGGFDLRKNLPALLEAFAQAAPALGPEWRLVIGGAPHSANPVVFPRVEPIIQRLGLEGRVVLTGRLSEEDKITLHQGARIYVTTSLHEGFGLTALEAMACGVPVIASNRTSLPEVVGDGGLLVDPAPDAVAAAIVSVASDPAYAETLRARAIARAAQFSWRRTAQDTAAIYGDILARREAERHG